MRTNNGDLLPACIVLALVAEAMLLLRSLRRLRWGSLAILCIWFMPALARGAEKTPPMRTWISADGKFHVVARLAETQADAVILEKEDGSRITVPRAKLSAGDLAYVDRHGAPVAAATGGDRPKPASTPAKEVIRPAASIDNADSAKTVEETSNDRPKPDTGPAKADEQSVDKGAKPLAAASADGKDTRLTLKDIQQLRQQRTAPEQVVENIAEQGRGFEVTPEVAGQLRSLGFRPAQIDAIKESSSEPLVPGKYLTTSDQQRDQDLAKMKLVVTMSRVHVEPIESQHVTLWAAKDVQQKYLPDIRTVENLFHTRCAEPIHSGLDKRSTHVILLNDHTEYDAWWRAMFAAFGERFEEKDNPGGNAEFREVMLKGQSFLSTDFAVVCLARRSSDQMHRDVVVDVAEMYAKQLARPQGAPRELRPLETGFINWVETAVFGTPAAMFGAIVYHQGTVHPEISGGQAWSLLVRQRMVKNGATPLAELLTLDHSKMSESHYAEAWTLVELLAGQRGKFGKLLLATRDGASGLEAIEKVYGWNEKELAKEWRAYVMRQGNKK